MRGSRKYEVRAVSELSKQEDNKNLGGRPRLYSSPEEFESKIGEYEKFCQEKDYPITWTGLALFMGFSSRQSIDEYANYEGFSDSVKKAKTFIEWHYEMKLARGEGSPAGSIFALKNFGWKDKQEIEQTADSLPDAINKLIDRLPN